MQEVKPTENADSATAEVRAQHTPGPWEIKPSELGHNIIDGICMVYGGGRIPDANAHLIAAAPELLEACKRLVAITRNADAQQLKIAIAAIDKAEGRAL